MVLKRVLVIVFFYIIQCNVSLASEMETDKHVQSDICLGQIELIRNSPLQFAFRKANANIPRELSTERRFSNIQDFQTCLSIEEQVNGTLIQGKYCTVHVTVPNPMNPKLESIVPDDETLAKVNEYARRRQNIKMIYQIIIEDSNERIHKDTIKMPFWKRNTTTVSVGVCVPRACSTEDALPFVLENRPFLYGDQLVERLAFSDRFCQLHASLPFTTADYISIFIFVVIAIITVTSTVYDVNHCVLKKAALKPNRLYSSFSVYTNARRLTSGRGGGAVRCVDGIRALSIAWEIAGHINRQHTVYLNEQWSEFQHYFYETEHYVVDTFFLLSGFFVVYTSIRKYTTDSYFKSIPKYYLNRILRLYPIMISVLLLEVSVLNHIREWYRMSAELWLNRCSDLWWTVIFFVNNIIYISKSGLEEPQLCLHHSWYLAVDMQLYLMSPLVLLWLFGRKTVAWTALSIALLSSLTVCTALVFSYNFPFLMTRSLMNIDMYEWFTLLYCNVFIRAPPYFIGLMLGYLMHTLKGKKVNLNKMLLYIMWSLTILVFVISFYITKEMIYNYNQSLNNFLSSYQRIFWSLAISWIIFACHFGYGGPVNRLLSLNMWQLLSRLNYAMYFVHVPFATLFFIMNCGIVTDYSPAWVHIQNFAGLYMISFLVGATLVVLVEIPVINLQTIIQAPKNNKIAPVDSPNEITLRKSATKE